MKHRTQKPLPPDDRTQIVGARSWESLWQDALRPEALNKRPAGEGWKSTADLTTEMRLSRYGVAYHMRRRIAAGMIEVAYGRGANGQRMAFYRPTTNKPPTA